MKKYYYMILTMVLLSFLSDMVHGRVPGVINLTEAGQDFAQDIPEKEELIFLEVKEFETPEVVYLDQSGIESKIRRTFGDEAEIALGVARCESSMDPSRIGDKHMDKWSYGLFQINQTWHKHTKEQLLDEDFNIKKAKEIRDRYGWTQWTTYKNGCYLTK